MSDQENDADSVPGDEAGLEGLFGTVSSFYFGHVSSKSCPNGGVSHTSAHISVRTYNINAQTRQASEAK